MISKTIFKNRPWGSVRYFIRPIAQTFLLTFLLERIQILLSFSSSVQTTNHTVKKSALKMIVYYV